MKPIETTASLLVNAPRARVFEIATGEDLKGLFAAHGLLPGVAQFDGARDWRTVGETRRIRLTDGAALTETLTAFAPGARFAYRGEAITGPLGALASNTAAEWFFVDESGATRIDWTYRFTPKTAPARPLLAFFARALWPGYMRAVLKRLKERAETP